jgi:hypothetical protein
VAATSALGERHQPENRQIVAFCGSASKDHLISSAPNDSGYLLPRAQHCFLCAQAVFMSAASGIAYLFAEPSEHGVAYCRL